MHPAFEKSGTAHALTSCGIVALALGLLSVSAHAQQSAAKDEVIEEIHVTGSRIARDPNLGAPVAVQSVTAEDIQLSGKMDVVEVVKEIPALLTSETGDSSASPAGSAFDSDESAVGNVSGESVL